MLENYLGQLEEYITTDYNDNYPASETCIPLPCYGRGMTRPSLSEIWIPESIYKKSRSQSNEEYEYSKITLQNDTDPKNLFSICADQNHVSTDLINFNADSEDLSSHVEKLKVSEAEKTSVSNFMGNFSSSDSLINVNCKDLNIKKDYYMHKDENIFYSDDDNFEELDNSSKLKINSDFQKANYLQNDVSTDLLKLKVDTDENNKTDVSSLASAKSDDRLRSVSSEEASSVKSGHVSVYENLSFNAEMPSQFTKLENEKLNLLTHEPFTNNHLTNSQQCKKRLEGKTFSKFNDLENLSKNLDKLTVSNPKNMAESKRQSSSEENTEDEEYIQNLLSKRNARMLERESEEETIKRSIFCKKGSANYYFADEVQHNMFYDPVKNCNYFEEKDLLVDCKSEFPDLPSQPASNNEMHHEVLSPKRELRIKNIAKDLILGSEDTTVNSLELVPDDAETLFDEEHKIIVENIPQHTDEEELKFLIQGYGEIKKFSVSQSMDKKKAEILMTCCDPAWIVDCIDESKPFGGIQELSAEKIE